MLFRSVSQSRYTIIQSSGSAYTEIWTNGNLSDERLKENINVITGSLNKIKQIRGVTYNWIDKNKGTSQEIGVIAQDLLPVLPQLVVENNSYYSVNYLKLAPVLIEAIKEQQTIIENLKSRIETLENNK